jgi:hypothetical protein
MRKVIFVVLAVFFVAGFAASAWAADIPGQKLTPNELASVTGKASPFTIPVSFFQNLSSTGTTVFINGKQEAVTGVTVTARATFKK